MPQFCRAISPWRRKCAEPCHLVEAPESRTPGPQWFEIRRRYKLVPIFGAWRPGRVRESLAVWTLRLRFFFAVVTAERVCAGASCSNGVGSGFLRARDRPTGLSGQSEFAVDAVYSKVPLIRFDDAGGDGWPFPAACSLVSTRYVETARPHDLMVPSGDGMVGVLVWFEARYGGRTRGLLPAELLSLFWGCEGGVCPALADRTAGASRDSKIPWASPSLSCWSLVVFQYGYSSRSSGR